MIGPADSAVSKRTAVVKPCGPPQKTLRGGVDVRDLMRRSSAAVVKASGLDKDIFVVLKLVIRSIPRPTLLGGRR